MIIQSTYENCIQLVFCQVDKNIWINYSDAQMIYGLSFEVAWIMSLFHPWPFSFLFFWQLIFEWNYNFKAEKYIFLIVQKWLNINVTFGTIMDISSLVTSIIDIYSYSNEKFEKQYLAIQGIITTKTYHMLVKYNHE